MVCGKVFRAHASMCVNPPSVDKLWGLLFFFGLRMHEKVLAVSGSPAGPIFFWSKVSDKAPGSMFKVMNDIEHLLGGASQKIWVRANMWRVPWRICNLEKSK